jgi:radical SAM protein (TIGR01212 family)
MFSTNKPYRDFSEYLSSRFPYKVQKISINAGFSCPNRDGSKGYGGCTYCNNQSFSPGYGNPTRTISQQLENGIKFFSYKYPEMKYLAYFQSYTNTHDSIESLIEKYEEALSYPEVVGLIVGTRPDCMPDKLLNYFETLSKKTFVMIEYGVESTLNKTLDRVNRLHSYEESEYMIRKTAEKGLVVGAHMILGLPGETKDEILSHADKLSVLPLTSLKLHQLQIIKGTVMSREYRVNPSAFSLFELDDYINMCVSFSEKLNPDIYIERFTSQSPEKLLIAPEWGLKNYVVRDMIIKRFNEFKTYQGKLYKVHSESLI